MQDATAPALPVWARRAQEARGTLSQEAWAAQVNVSTATISRIERGLHEPRWGTAVKFAKATGKSAPYFLGEDDEEVGGVARLVDVLIEALVASRAELPARIAEKAVVA